jgi:hypothetical protein
MLENIILINYMAALSRNLQVVASIGGNSRMARRKDMGHKSGLMEKDTSGSTCRVSDTGTEYIDGQMEENIMDSGKRINVMATDISRVLMVQNITDHGRIAKDREMQSKTRMGSYTQ